MTSIPLSPSILRKARALAILTGAQPADFEAAILSTLEIALDRKIVEAVGGVPQDAIKGDVAPGSTSDMSLRRGFPENVGVSSDPALSNNLGDLGDFDAEDTGSDDEDIIKGLKEMDALVPSSGGLSESDIEKDMDVEDLDVEAKADASKVKEPSDKSSDRYAEELFSQALGLDEVDHRIAKRKKVVRSRAKVTGFDGTERAET